MHNMILFLSKKSLSQKQVWDSKYQSIGSSDITGVLSWLFAFSIFYNEYGLVL
jgi:hypothetical protein